MYNIRNMDQILKSMLKQKNDNKGQLCLTLLHHVLSLRAQSQHVVIP